jgi:hypothetical protein
MTIADEIYPLATWHAPALSDTLDATRLRPFSTCRCALLTLRRVRR